MNFPDNDDDFRAHIRAVLNSLYTEFQANWHHDSDPGDLSYRRAWEDLLCKQGLSGLSWPREYGGHQLPLSQQAIFHEEHARCGAPLGVNLIGHGILAPTILHYGTQAQKDRFLPNILDNTEVWCQGYSEPSSGSDLASLRTQAIREGDVYRLKGHKIWTSFANLADWCFVLARTGLTQSRSKGLSFLLVDMKSPGIRVEPIRQLTGDAEFCEVFFEDVLVPVTQLVGEEGQGWRIAMGAASFERGTYFLPRLIRFEQELEQIRAWLTKDALQTATNAQQHQWARLAVDSHVLKLKTQRALRLAQTGNTPGAEGSATKVHWSEAHQALLDFAMDLLGPDVCLSPAHQSHTDHSRFIHAYLWSRAETILAGTSEIQRNIIAEHIMGLPRDR